MQLTQKGDITKMSSLWCSHLYIIVKRQKNIKTR